MACGGGATDQVGAQFGRGLPALDSTRWVWVEAECVDGELDLAREGFERELHLEVQGRRLLMTYDSEFARSGCTETVVWLAEPHKQLGHWRFDPQARVTLPVDDTCGVGEMEPMDGTLIKTGDLLEVVAYRSPWCRGFDARFVYRMAVPRRYSERQVIGRYVAHFNRRDAAAVAGLFAESGSLVEPFSSADDGNNRRHDGRPAVRAWYASAFASAPWLAMRLLAIEPGDGAGAHVAGWQYMDARLDGPLGGRNLFTIADGEIYEAEVQLITQVVVKKGIPPGEADAAVEAAP